MDQKKSLFDEQEETASKIDGLICGRNDRRPLSELVNREMLEDLYLIKEKSLQDIAKMFGCTRQTIQLLMQRHQIGRRDRSSARTLAIKNNKFERFDYYNINEAFFSSWTPAMAWILGLLFTDGYIMETGAGRRVILSSVDIELLEKVRVHLGSNRAIQKKVQPRDKTKHIFTFEFFRERMRTDLISLGLTQRKSLIMQFPDVPKSLMRHFIRGCWDGDGSVYIDKENKLNASYVSGSKSFVEVLVAELFKVGIAKQTSSSIPQRMRALKEILGPATFKEHFPQIADRDPLSISKDKRSNAYTIKLNSRSNLENLFHFFYDGVDDTLFLRRKYDVFVKGLYISEDTRKAMRGNSYQRKSIPIKHAPHAIRRGAQEHNDAVPRETNRIHTKKVLRIKNDDGRMKCLRCGEVSAILYMSNEVYCAACFAKFYKEKIQK